MSALHAVITGRVQGVGFRAWTRDTARGLGLTGWVRNRDDGNVEALFDGEAEALEEMTTALQDGPSLARVDDVATRRTDPVDAVGFEIR